MRKLKSLLLASAMLAVPAVCNAVPVLQLGIDAAHVDYDDSADEENIVTSSPTFTIYALLKPKKQADLTEDYFLSIAVVPKLDDIPGGYSFGTFDITDTSTAGATWLDSQNSWVSLPTHEVQVTGDMVFGIPPLEANVAKDPKDLPRHGIFETYFTEVKFQFDATKRLNRINTQDNPGGPFEENPYGPLYYATFTFDIGKLDEDVHLHFDLYNTKVRNNSDYDADDFAPFSHDAQTIGGAVEAPPATVVPEPSTWIVVTGLVLCCGLARFWKRPN